MKIESLLFGLTATFFFVVAIPYGIWSNDPIGITALILTGGLCLIVGGYFWFISRRIDARPEDRQDADIAEGAGELGFFSPGSYWPVGIAAAAVVMGLGLAFWYPWLIGLGAIAILIAVGGLLFEYYTGQNIPTENVPH